MLVVDDDLFPYLEFHWPWEHFTCTTIWDMSIIFWNYNYLLPSSVYIVGCNLLWYVPVHSEVPGFSAQKDEHQPLSGAVPLQGS